MTNPKDPRIEEILLALDIIKKKLPNGELEVIKQSILSLGDDQKTIKEDLEYFKKRMFNPDDGVIVRINKNTSEMSRFNDSIDKIPSISNKIDNMEMWKSNVSKALWIVYTSIIGIILSLVVGSWLKK